MKEKRFTWFPCYPDKLLGALAAMKPTEGYVYVVVCLRIYEVNGPCEDTLDALARRTGYNKRVVSDALDRLFRMGKLVRVGPGIMNQFAETVIADSMAVHERRKHAGQKGGRPPAEKLEENQSMDQTRAKAGPKPAPPHLQIQEQEIESKKGRIERVPESRELPFANATGSSLPPKVKGKNIGTRLPDDWTPSPAEIDYGLRLGLSRKQVDDAAEDMRIWAGANANRSIARKADWVRAFQGWLRTEAKRRGAGAHGANRQIGGQGDRGIAPGVLAARRYYGGVR